MKPEAQRIAIAEACGWSAHDVRNNEKYWFVHASRPRTCIAKFELPDYLNDLNAMHEAEKALSDEQGSLYRHILSLNSDGPRATYLTVERAMCHATAQERAKAFLRTLNLWKDEA
jgi:hypothetical protein